MRPNGKAQNKNVFFIIIFQEIRLNTFDQEQSKEEAASPLDRPVNRGFRICKLF